MAVAKKGEKSYSIQKLWSRQKEIIRLVASGLHTQREVAEILGIAESTVSNIVTSALGRQTLDMLEGAADAETVDLMVKIRALAPIALSVQEEMLLDAGTPQRLKNDISNKVLDRAGYVPVNKNLNMNVNRGLTQEDIDSIKRRAKQLSGEVEEAECVD